MLVERKVVERKVVERFAGRDSSRLSVCLKLECGHINCFHGGGHDTPVGAMFPCLYCEKDRPCPWTDADMKPYNHVSIAEKVK